jgi:hypothetical protein
VSCCDRVLVLRDRHSVGEVLAPDLSESAIMSRIAEVRDGV